MSDGRTKSCSVAFALTKQRYVLVSTCVLIGDADGLAPQRLAMSDGRRFYDIGESNALDECGIAILSPDNW
jgi:hypothetical protein